MTSTTALLAAVVIVIAAHCLAGVYVATAYQVPRSRRFLAFIFLLTLPSIGVVLARTALTLRGREDSPAFFGEPEVVKVDRSAQKSLLVDRAPLLDRLAGTREERLAALAELSKTGSENAITTLRWTIEHGESDAVVEAALTLEKLIEEGMGAVAAAKKGMASTNAVALAASGQRVADLIESGLLDSALAPRMAIVVRDLFRAAELRADGLEAAVAISWARLELQMMAPEEGLAILGRALPPVDDDMQAAVAQLEGDLRFAARRSVNVG